MLAQSSESFLEALFAEAVAASDPMRVVPAALPPRPSGRVLVVGAGKASARMAEAVEAAWGPCEGLIITRTGYECPTQGIEIASAGHPIPDARGLAATERLLAKLAGLSREDFVLALISGGASALLVAPAPGVSLADKQAITRALLASGATIEEINAVRRHLSRVKGGQMAAKAFPARVLALLISDVPGDDLATIGSGPTVGCLPGDPLNILQKYGIEVDPRLAAVFARPSPVIRPDDPRLARVENRLIAAPAQALSAAAARARAAGVVVECLGDALAGEARAVAAEQARQALAVRERLKRGDKPVLLLSGGELTVTVRGTGVGGPNAEFALALACALGGAERIYAIACDTDGVDGGAEVAGALIGPNTWARARALGLDPEAALAENNAHGFFAAVGGQVITGPTLTNVNDFRAILVLPPGQSRIEAR